MTKEIMKIDGDSIYFDCRCHAGNREVCAMCSTICNMITCACDRHGIPPAVDEDGHISYNIEHASKALRHVFEDAQRCFDAIAEEFPDYLKCY